MESLFIDKVQQEKTIGRWDSAKRRKMFSVLGVMAALLLGGGGGEDRGAHRLA